jgi:DNA-binding PucR family transcriptional regulator
MEGVFDGSWRLSTADLVQQTAAYLWLNKGDEHKHLYEVLTGARVANELYQRLGSDSAIEVYRNQCMTGIVDYIKAHPKASQAELTKAVETHINVFKQQLEAL